MIDKRLTDKKEGQNGVCVCVFVRLLSLPLSVQAMATTSSCQRIGVVGYGHLGLKP